MRLPARLRRARDPVGCRRPNSTGIFRPVRKRPDDAALNPRPRTPRQSRRPCVVAALERPTPAGANAPGFGSDVVADTLRSLDIPYIALTPGASYRGLHDSIVNYLGNSKPQMLLCVHEEAAVAIAHGYAKVTGEAMVTAVHSNVGLLHATMAIFNAWCDRMPVVVLARRVRSTRSSAGRGSTGFTPRATRAR